ncbi:hypothetical protein KIN20_014391 [Parelaphostrongylus tenuis]|uniref:Uncharacterized protein n=1 Tax=Parelaphostrongylus tenuis TaxID=148309 RepID=A0AAD5QLP0_PARTN|nr:hypothetical protein KIN20_014391 [Parelaphostrongylus tenuis]
MKKYSMNDKTSNSMMTKNCRKPFHRKALSFTTSLIMNGEKVFTETNAHVKGAS